MKQLGILDSAFINLEQANTPQHVGGMGIYDPSTAPGGFVRFKDVIAGFERRLSSMPLFRTRLVEVPGGIDRPYWVKDANFDVEFHLRHIALPEPGDWRQLCIQVARLHSRPLDMSRPLWEAYIIEGLDNIPNLPEGCFAIYTKMHHSLVDGAGGSSFMAVLHDLSPDPSEDDAIDTEPRLVDTDPSAAELLTRASINTVKNTARLVGGGLRTGRDLGKYMIDVARDDIPSPDVTAPKTILNKPVGPHRVFDAAEFPLEGFKDIKNATESTINDVGLAVVSGALRRYLQAKNELPEEGSLATGIPLNMRTRRGVTEENNQVGSAYASLHTDIEDPIELVRAIRESTDAAKKNSEANPLVDALMLSGVFAPAISKSLAGFWSRNELSRHIPLNISTCITNVMGPDFPLYSAGAKMVDYYALGVLTPGMGLFHAIFSYSGKVTLSVLGDRNIMPDPEFYHDCLVASYEELYAAASALQPPKGKNKVAVAAKAKIESPRRKRSSPAKAPAKSKTKAKSTAKGKSTKKAPAKSKAARKAPAKRKAVKKAPAKRKTATKAKTAARRASASRPKATRRKTAAGKARPKLRS